MDIDKRRRICVSYFSWHTNIWKWSKRPSRNFSQWYPSPKLADKLHNWSFPAI